MRRLFWLIAIFVSIMFGGIVISKVYGEQKVPVPEFYGVYIVSDGKLITPKDAVKEKRLKTVGHLMSSSFGIKELSGISVSQNSYFIIYGETLKPYLNRLKLGKFEFARQVLIKGMWPAKDEMVSANMWVFKKEIPMNVGPVKGQTELLRLVPTSPLSEGVYALYVGPVGSDVPIAAMEIEMVEDFTVGKMSDTKVETIPQAETPSPIPPQTEVPSSEPSPAISKEITIASITKNMPDTDYFVSKEVTLNLDYDNVWDIVMEYLIADVGYKQTHFTITDKERGMLLTKVVFGSSNTKSAHAILIEKITQDSSKVTVKGFGWIKSSSGYWDIWKKESDHAIEVISKKANKKIKEKIERTIADQWKLVAKIPQPKRDWRELVTLKITGKYDDYSTLYLMGLNRRSLSNDALVSADKFLEEGFFKKADLKNGKKYADLATRHYIESNELFKASEQVFIGSIEMTAQTLEAMYRGPKEASKYGWFLMCGPKCYEVADYVFLMTDFAMDYGLEGMDEAKKNLIINAFVKTLLKTSVVSKWIENRTTHLIGDSGLYGLIDKTINSPEFQKAFMEVLAESGAYTTQKMANEGGKKIIRNSLAFIKGSSNLKPAN